MSYVSGFMMGAAIGKSIRQMFESSESAAIRAKKAQLAAKPQTVFALVAATLGRRRYRADALNNELAALLEEKLAKLGFIKTIKINPISKSLLFTYDATDEVKMDALASWLQAHVFTVKAKATPVINNQAVVANTTTVNTNVDLKSVPSEAHAGSITRSARSMGRAFSAWIKDHTCGWFDISSLASMLFFMRGLRKMMLTRQYPSGAQMLWWALSLMRGWRTV